MSTNLQDAPRGMHNNYVGLASDRPATTLEHCANQQSANADYINNIGNRIVELIDKLQGRRGREGQASCGDAPKSNGLLNDHKDALEYEGNCLGAIQADLAVLEELL